MMMTIDDGGGHESRPLAETARQGAARRRIADLEAVITRQKAVRSHLSAQGLPTHEVERIIEILVCSVQLVRDCQAAIDYDGKPVEEPSVSLKAIS